MRLIIRTTRPRRGRRWLVRMCSPRSLCRLRSRSRMRSHLCWLLEESLTGSSCCGSGTKTNALPSKTSPSVLTTFVLNVPSTTSTQIACLSQETESTSTTSWRTMVSSLNLIHLTTRKNLTSARITLVIYGLQRARSLSAQTKERSCSASPTESTRCFSKAPLKMDSALRTSLSPQRASSSAETMELSTSMRRLKSPRTLIRR